MRFFTLLSVLLFSFLLHAQDRRGYYITETGQKIEGYFKDADFEKIQDPQFTTLPGGKYQTLLPSVVKEYGIEGRYKFKTHTVKVDLSQSVSLNTYSTVKEPKWEKRTIFLNVISEGEATLYSAYVGEEMKYFYSLKSRDAEPLQLVYKKYYNGQVVRENNSFRQELFANVNCDLKSGSFENLRYEEKALTSIIDKYNECKGGGSTSYVNESPEEEESMKFTIGAGVNINTFIIDADGNTESSSEVAPSIAAEAAFVMPYSKLGFFARIDYTKVSNEVMSNVDYTESLRIKGDMDANFISLLLGPRVYLGKQKAEKGLFIDAGLGLAFGSGTINRTIYQITNNELLPINNIEYAIDGNLFVGVGAGYNISRKFGIDVRYETNRKVVNNVGDFKFGKMGVNIRYTIN